MVPFFSVVGCLLIAYGLWGSAMNLSGRGTR